MESAVLLLVFNRPDTTRIVFDVIRKVQPPRLYIAADGPRADRAGEKDKCDEVRRIVGNIDWACEIKTLYQDSNLGCRYAVSSAITWFFDQEEEGIILEDDVLPALQFFTFCDELLKRYRHETRVAMISGCNPAATRYTTKHDYAFSHHALIWGWATWRRAWRDYDVNIDRWNMIDKASFFKHLPHSNGLFSSMWTTIFNNVVEGKIDTWCYQWNFSLMDKNRLSVIPKMNMIDNIGYQPNATHTVETKPEWLVVPMVIQMSGDSPAHIAPDSGLDTEISDVVFNVNRKRRFLHAIKAALMIG